MALMGDLETRVTAAPGHTLEVTCENQAIQAAINGLNLSKVRVLFR